MKKKPSPAETGANALTWAASRGIADQITKGLERAATARRRRRVVAGAVALLLAGTLATFVKYAQVSPPAAGGTVATASRQVLSDGSAVDLKPGAGIVTAFTASSRRITLTTGEAQFHVTKDPNRPFVVSAAGIEVRAVGTVFSVDYRDKSVEVVVLEGRVAVNQSTTPNPNDPVFVDAGHRITVELRQPALVARDAKSPDSNPARLSAMVPRLDFSATPLSEVIRMFNEQGHARLELDPSLGNIELSGSVSANDVDSLLLLLKNEFGIESHRRPDGQIRLDLGRTEK